MSPTTVIMMQPANLCHDARWHQVLHVHWLSNGPNKQLPSLLAKLKQLQCWLFPKPQAHAFCCTYHASIAYTMTTQHQPKITKEMYTQSDIDAEKKHTKRMLSSVPWPAPAVMRQL